MISLLCLLLRRPYSSDTDLLGMHCTKPGAALLSTANSDSNASKHAVQASAMVAMFVVRERSCSFQVDARDNRAGKYSIQVLSEHLRASLSLP